MAAKHKNEGSGKALGIGAGVIAAAAVGAYLLYGKDAAKHRKKVKGWAVKAKGEIVEGLERLGDVSEDAYHKTVDEVTARYRGMKHVDAKELAALVADAKRYWKAMKSGAKTKKTTRKKSASRK